MNPRTLVAAGGDALASIDVQRFYETERGFQALFAPRCAAW
jgi:hypothetical protein